MKRLSIAILFLSGLITGRCQKSDYRVKSQIPAAVLVFLAGCADGANQLISYHYKDFKKAFPKANDNFWYPPQSFARKYKNGDPKQGERFPGSKGIFVFATDGYHLTRFTERLFLSGAFALTITGKRQKWWVYAVQGVSFWCINRLGFVAVFNSF